MKSRKSIHHALAAALLAAGLLAAVPCATAAEIGDITGRDGGDAGLVVLVEPEDVTLAAELAAGGRHLVVALSADAARVARWDAALAKAGVHPVADAIHWRNPARLPFPTNKVNILVLDAATAERLGEDEVRRAIIPGHGFALVGGREIRKPRPEGMDQWLAYRRDGTGNRASRDMLDPPNSIQFLAAGAIAGQGTTLMTDRVLLHRGGRNSGYEAVHRRHAPSVRAYDPFSGVVRWSLPRTLGHRHAKRWMFEIFTDGQRLFAPRSDSGSRRGEPLDLGMMTLDLLSGETIEEHLPHIRWGEGLMSGKVPVRGPFVYPGTMHIAGTGERIYQIDVDHTVRALSADGTELIWETRFNDDEYTYQVASDGEIVVVLLTVHNDYSGGDPRGGGGPRIVRGRMNRAAALVGLDAATGEERWRYEGVKGFPLMYMVVDYGAVVACSHLYELGQEDMAADNIVVSLDAATGREHFRRAGLDGFKDTPDIAARRGGVSVMEDKIVWLGQNMTIFALRTGEVVNEGASVSSPVHPQSTHYNIISPRWLIEAHGTFVSYDGNERHEYGSNVTKTSYTGLNRVANHMLYMKPCPSNTYPLSIGDLLAMAHEKHFPAVLPDDRRLLVSGRAEGVREAAPADWPTFRGDFGRRGWRAADGPAKLEPAWEARVDISGPQGDIPLGWTLNSLRPGPITQPVADGRRVLVAVPERHELVCLDLADGGELWTTRLSGRVTAPPTLAGDVAFVGVNDGTVSAVNLDDGSVIWTFLAAPYERYYNAHQQLESTHPVYSSPVLLDGTLYVNAGRHGRDVQGILVWALDPATGEPKGRQTVTGTHNNEVLQVVGDQLRVSLTALDPETLDRRAFDGGRGPHDAPFLLPRREGIGNSTMGWIGPQGLWNGYTMFGLEDAEWRGPSTIILTDDNFASAGGHRRGIRYLELGLDRPSVRQPDRMVEWSVGVGMHDDLHPVFAGAGRYRYLASLPNPHRRWDQQMYLSVWDASAQEPERFQLTVEPVHDGEAFIPDGIAVAHGHLIITTTEGRVLAFRQP